jgi:hypothetical protein
LPLESAYQPLTGAFQPTYCARQPDLAPFFPTFLSSTHFPALLPVRSPSRPLLPFFIDTYCRIPDYLISLTTQNPDTYYFLSVEIPANIHFQPGAYSATIDGFIDVDTFFHPDVMTRIRYLANAFAGQTMTIDLNSADLDDLSLGVVGQQDGQVYIRYQVKNSGGEVYSPISQGYYLDVYSTGGKSTAFSLEITIK